MENVMGTQKVAVIGFGYIGSVIGAVLASRGGGYVIGLERDPRIREAVQNNHSPFNEPGLDELIASTRATGRLEITDDTSRIADAEVFIITVGTPLSESYEPDFGQIRAAVGSIQPYIKDGSLVMLKSTVPPGTTSGVVEPIFSE
jgi:UDP-N-acetyl-D-mannosaminuronic acid dehydrogenase